VWVDDAANFVVPERAKQVGAVTWHDVFGVDRISRLGVSAGEATSLKR